MRVSYQYASNGDLQQYIDDELRAVVPAAHVEEFKQAWPDVPGQVKLDIPPTGV